MPIIDGQWTPNKKQALFLSLPNSVTEALYGGGNGSGKSEVLLAYPLIRGWYKNPRFKQVFMRRTYVELRNEIVPRSKEIYRHFGAKFNTSSMCWTFPREDQYGSGLPPSGAMVFLAHCEHEDDVHNYDSMEINLFTPDEITSFTEFIYTYIGFTRTRTSDSALPAIIRAAGMPGDIGHTWVKNRFVKPWPAGGKIIVGRAGVKRFYVHATVRDNPVLLKNDPLYIQKLEALPEAERQARLLGSWDAYLGQVFEEFREKRYADEPEHACHVIEPFDPPDWWPRIIGMDWGYAPPAMTWVGYAAISPKGQVIVYREQHWQKTQIEEWCAQVKPFIEKEKPRTIKLCKSAGQNRGQEHTILQQVSSALGWPVELSSNDPGSRVAGKMLMHEYLRWTPKFVPDRHMPVYDQSYAERLLRMGSVRDYQQYIKQFEVNAQEEVLPKLLIFKTCPMLIDSLKACMYDKTNPQDVAEFPGDDPYDGSRYIIDEADKYFDESRSEFERIQRQQAELDEFERTGDWNPIYHRARITKSTSSIGIRRYRNVH